jgi:UDP-N-acetylglucosamine 2-epimerase
LRDETEWVETHEDGWNYIVGANTHDIIEKTKQTLPLTKGSHFGNGKAGVGIIEYLISS